MQGRLQASVIAILGLPLISQAAAALVLLRLGTVASVLVFLAVIAPAILMAVLAKEQMLVILMAEITLVSTAVVGFGAWVLRFSQSWNTALAVVVSATLLLVLGLYGLQPEAVSLLTDEIVQTSQRLVEQGAAESAEPLDIGNRYTLGIVATVVAIGAIPCLILARWWQAVLYNPGGFRQEFLSLQLTPTLAISCLAASIYCYAMGGDTASWLALFMLPLLVAGLGLVHWVASARRIGGEWLFVFYLLFVFVAPVRGFLVVLALADSFLNLRGRIPPKPES